jgi:hypothetical protein
MTLNPGCLNSGKFHVNCALLERAILAGTAIVQHFSIVGLRAQVFTHVLQPYYSSKAGFRL